MNKRQRKKNLMNEAKLTEVKKILDKLKSREKSLDFWIDVLALFTTANVLTFIANWLLGG